MDDKGHAGKSTGEGVGCCHYDNNDPSQTNANENISVEPSCPPRIATQQTSMSHGERKGSAFVQPPRKWCGWCVCVCVCALLGLEVAGVRPSAKGNWPRFAVSPPYAWWGFHWEDHGSALPWPRRELLPEARSFWLPAQNCTHSSPHKDESKHATASKTLPL